MTSLQFALVPTGVRRAGRRGFSLVEVVMALGVFAFVGVGLIGLFSIGLNANRESVDELEATHLIQSWIAARRAAPTAAIEDRCPLPPLDVTAPVAPATPVYVNKFGQVVATAKDARFGLLYTIAPPGSTHNATRVHVRLFWPATAQPSQAVGSQEMSSVFLLP